MPEEIELKLALPPAALAALRRHPVVAGAEKLGNAVTLDNTYYDTPKLQLKARKVAVRTRRQGRRWLQTVKCAGQSSAGLSQRPEWEQAYTGAFDFSAIDARATAKLLRRHADALIPLFTTRFRRETRRLCPRDGVSILLMIDSGTVQFTAPDGSLRQTPICELELELEQGAASDLFTLACELAQTLPLMPADVSKAERGYRLYLDLPLRPTHAEVSTLSADQGVVEAFRDRAYACVRHWQANVADALALAAAQAQPQPQPQSPEALAPELTRAQFIHQLRIALRHLRALLRLFAPALPAGFAGQWNARLRDNARRFEDARELDVLHDELLTPVDSAILADASAMTALLQTTHSARDAAHRVAAQALDMAEQGRLLLEFSAALLHLPAHGLVPALDLRSFARLRLERLRKRARGQFDAAQALEPTRLHVLRLGCKQLRYGLEVFAPLFGAQAVARYRARVVKAQASLGFLQDVDVAHARMQTWATSDASLQPAITFVLGWHGPRYTHLCQRVLRHCQPVLWGKTPW